MILKNIKFAFLAFFSILMITSCQIDEIVNPNGPTTSALEENATLADLRLLANGMTADLRTGLEYYYWTVSMVGREYYDLRDVDPRFTGELLGKQGAVLDNNGFLVTRSYAARYKAVKEANILINATTASKDAEVTDQVRDGVLGYGKTWKAYCLLLAANRQYNNGIRIDVNDPDNLGPFTASYAESLAGIADLLDEANRHLTDAGDIDFPFYSPNFSTTAGFSSFNRAISARVALYRNDNNAALNLLEDSFMDLTAGADLKNGVFHEFRSQW